jgi:Recombination directionality factor-like
MPMLDVQKEGAVIGRIRIGTTAPAKNGKTKPISLLEFRLTTDIPKVADKVAELWGGEPRQVKLFNGKKTIEVMTERDELPILLPPKQQIVTQWWEMWSAAGCARRCDSVTETKSQKPCMCPEDLDQRAKLAQSGSACRPTTRLSVMLPDVPGLGVWMLTTGGMVAAKGIGGIAEALEAARAAKMIIPAVIRNRWLGQGVNQYVSPYVHVEQSVSELVALQGRNQSFAEALDAAPSQQAALPSGVVPVQPVGVREISNLDDEPIEAEIVHDDELDAEHQAELDKRIQAGNFPQPWSRAVELQVERWRKELLGDQHNGRPFE